VKISREIPPVQNLSKYLYYTRSQAEAWEQEVGFGAEAWEQKEGGVWKQVRGWSSGVGIDD